MKNIFKFAAMAFAAVVMFASCDKKDDKTPDAPAATLDGKVLKVTVENMGDIYFDFGKFAANQITMGMDGAMYGMEGTIIAINPLGYTYSDDNSEDFLSNYSVCILLRYHLLFVLFSQQALNIIISEHLFCARHSARQEGTGV